MRKQKYAHAIPHFLVITTLAPLEVLLLTFATVSTTRMAFALRKLGGAGAVALAPLEVRRLTFATVSTTRMAGALRRLRGADAVAGTALQRTAGTASNAPIGAVLSRTGAAVAIVEAGSTPAQNAQTTLVFPGVADIAIGGEVFPALAVAIKAIEGVAWAGIGAGSR